MSRTPPWMGASALLTTSAVLGKSILLSPALGKQNLRGLVR